MKFLGYFFVTTMTMILCTIYSGYTLSILWAWFLVPTFNLPFIDLPSAIGISLIVNYMTQSVSTKKDNRTFAEILIANTIAAILKPSFALFFGWIIKGWI